MSSPDTAESTQIESAEANAPANDRDAESPIDWPTPMELLRAAIASAQPENDGAVPGESLWARTRNPPGVEVPAASDASTREEFLTWLKSGNDPDASILEIEPLDAPDHAAIVMVEPSIVTRLVDSLPPSGAPWVLARDERSSAPGLEVLAVPRSIPTEVQIRGSSDSDPLAMRLPEASPISHASFVPPRLSLRSLPRVPKPSEVPTLPPPPPARVERVREPTESSGVREGFFAIVGFAMGCLCMNVAVHAALPDAPRSNGATTARFASRPVTRPPAAIVRPAESRATPTAFDRSATRAQISSRGLSQMACEPLPAAPVLGTTH